jgi:hypothetical protein
MYICKQIRRGAGAFYYSWCACCPRECHVNRIFCIYYVHLLYEMPPNKNYLIYHVPCCLRECHITKPTVSTTRCACCTKCRVTKAILSTTCPAVRENAANKSYCIHQVPRCALEGRVTKSTVSTTRCACCTKCRVSKAFLSTTCPAVRENAA